MKTNRKVALSKEDKQQGKYQRVDSLQLEENKTYQIWLEGIDFPMLLSNKSSKTRTVQQVFSI